ncbi:MAG: T9SS type A sorting domain-containing protein, partial [Planctomycetes bacterium]|nr:T9SS type A sorting domain-containing protein [Planctomycetota bacterium]
TAGLTFNVISDSTPLVVIETYPENFATNVSTSVQIEITFSQALFVGSMGYPINFMIFSFPYFPTGPNVVSMSPDNRTVYIDAQLADNTTQKLLITSALATTGAVLEEPEFLVFSTGPEVSSGNITGQAWLPTGIDIDFEQSGDPLVFLTNQYLLVSELEAISSFEELLNVTPVMAGITPIDLISNVYSFYFLDDGYYFVYGLFFATLQSGDEVVIYGYYDQGADGQPDGVTIIDGELIADIDFEYYLPSNTIESDERLSTFRDDLRQNYPNPFYQSTTIAFSLAQDSPVSLEIYNPAGQSVRLLIDEPMSSGLHRLAWDGNNDQGQPVSSGIYFYQLQTGAHKLSKKLLLLR